MSEELKLPYKMESQVKKQGCLFACAYSTICILWVAMLLIIIGGLGFVFVIPQMDKIHNETTNAMSKFLALGKDRASFPKRCITIANAFVPEKYDIGNATATKMEECCSLCLNDTLCKSWTWKPLEEMCWFKSVNHDVIYVSEGWYSGAIEFVSRYSGKPLFDN